MGDDPQIGQILGGFHHRVDFWLVGVQPQCDTKWRWQYPPLEVGVLVEGLEEVETYFLFCHNIAVQYIATRPKLDLCIES